MTLLLLAIFISTLIFLFYYEFLLKDFEKKRGKGLISMARDFFFTEKEVYVGAVSGDWDDWRYRLTVELHRNEQLDSKRASQTLGVSQDLVEKYLDQLESEGKVQQIGDAERGIYYKAVNEI